MAIDLTRKTRGIQPLRHFIIVPIVLIVFSTFYMVAVIDYRSFDAEFDQNDAYALEVRFAFWRVFMFSMVCMWCSATFYFLLICCPNQIWYGLLSFVLIIYSVLKLTGVTVSTSDVVGRKVMEQYTYGCWAYIICWAVYLVSDIYMAVILFILGFFHQYDDEEEEELDEVVVSEKSVRSTKSTMSNEDTESTEKE